MEALLPVTQSERVRFPSSHPKLVLSRKDRASTFRRSGEVGVSQQSVKLSALAVIVGSNLTFSTSYINRAVRLYSGPGVMGMIEEAPNKRSRQQFGICCSGSIYVLET